MSYLNEEYKKYFYSVLEEVIGDLLYEDEHRIDMSPKLKFKIDYIKLRMRNIKEAPVEFDYVPGYEPTNEWRDIPEVQERLLGYKDWLHERRERGIRTICESI